MAEESASPRPVKKLKKMQSENAVDLQDDDMISRFSGYFEALRSKMNYFIALEERVTKRDEVLADYFFTLEEDEEKIEIPQVLPFPVGTCNLDDLISLHALQNTQPLEGFDSRGPNDNSDLIVWAMRDFMFQLWGLHHSGAAHGNLKPQNVLIIEGDCKLKSTVDDDDSLSLEWKAPEQILHNTTTKASDMFTFGCILYFSLTKGCHPFGETPEQCIQNIVANKADISLIEDYTDAHHLISLLLNPEPELRPAAHSAFNHPFLKHPIVRPQILRAICKVSLFREDLADRIKCKIPMFGNEKWRKRFFEFFDTFFYSFEHPFEDFKDVFGGRGSPTFFPTILMEAMNAAVEIGLYKDHNWSTTGGGQILDSDYELWEACGSRFAFLYE